MKSNITNTSILVMILLLSLTIRAQENTIVLSPELADNSERFKVKIGTMWMNKIAKFKFGDYSVLDSKNGWYVTKGNSNFLGTKSETTTENSFSFILGFKKSDSAFVNAISNTSIKELHSLNLLSSDYLELRVGNDELIEDIRVFSSFINTTIKKEDSWDLLLRYEASTNEGEITENFLSNGKRFIEIIPVNSRENGKDKRRFPALGYEFIEDGKSIGAVQYFGGGSFGLNKNIVWLSNGLDEHMKLILSAAMTSIMQLKLSSL